ncbi:modin protein [Rutstroemia sp. NJR-2017a WRK4]|nr:modin protein [Rutstroemia sp. NJR-2017a WRK4]
MAWDASTISAVAALVVASFALLVALAQVLQQYFVTGQLIRLCDSVVFGPLPGQGHRKWEWAQFRFRVLYTIPQISLDAKLWPDSYPHVKSYATGRYDIQSLMKLHGRKDETLDDSASTGSISLGRKVGEASWVSFWRVIQRYSGESVRFDEVEYDADRCPTDLVTAPMQVSMRDIIVMGLMSGMRITSSSFQEKSVSMQGDVGTITSSNHPVLGPILHFTPRDMGDLTQSGFATRGYISSGIVRTWWLARTWGVCRVAGKFYHGEERRTLRRLDERWIQSQTGARVTELYPYGDIPSEPRHRKGGEGKGRAQNSEVEAKVGVGAYSKDQHRNDGTKAGSADAASNHNSALKKTTPGVIGRRLQDGPWIIAVPAGSSVDADLVARGKTKNRASKGRYSKRPIKTPHPTKPVIEGNEETQRSKYQATVEDEPEDTGVDARPQKSPRDNPKLSTEAEEDQDRINTARKRQEARRERIFQMERDKSLVQESVKRGAIVSPYQAQPTRMLLTQHPHNQSAGKANQPLEPTSEEDEALKRERERIRLQKQRQDEREERNQARLKAVDLTKVGMFWMCQMDIFYGYWATSWHNFPDVPSTTALVGATTVILEALLGFLDGKSLVYTNSNPGTGQSFSYTEDWLRSDNVTYPAYAVNGRGGVIAGGVSWLGVRIPAFKNTIIPQLELLHSYEWQVSRKVHDQIYDCEKLNTELMRLDSWLSYVGRTNEIGDGPNKLLKNAPAVADLLMEEFELDFQNIDLSASEGGLPDIQAVAALVMDFLTNENLTEAEQLYMLIVLLRAVKVGQSILAGANTWGLYHILVNDIQAHLV